MGKLALTFKDPIEEQNAYFINAAVEIIVSNTGKSNFYPVQLVKIDPNATALNVTSDRLFNGNEFTWHVGVNLAASFREDTTGSRVIFKAYIQHFIILLNKFFFRHSLICLLSIFTYT